MKRPFQYSLRATKTLVLITTLSAAQIAGAVDSVRIMDDGDPGFSLVNPAAWFKTDRLGFNLDYLSGLGAGTALWSFSVNPGSYRVSLTWYNPGYPYNAAYSTAAPFSILQDSTVLKSGTLNFTAQPADRVDAGVGWKDLGVVNITSTSLKILLSATATAFSIADAVRIERTDGTPITSPTITSLSPNNSPLTGGIPITISGKYFPTGCRVMFGSKASPQVTFVNSTQLKAVAPANAPGTVNITVITPDALSTSLPGFKYAVARTLDDGEIGFSASAPLSAITRVGFQADYVLPGGTARASTASWTMVVNKTPSHRVAVTWYDAGAPYNAMYANNVIFDVMDGSTVLASVPANLQQKPGDLSSLGCGWKHLGYFKFPSGQLKVVLRNNTDMLLMADAIRVEQLYPAPTLTSLTPTQGTTAGGTAVVLTGANFLEGAAVKFGSTAAKSVKFNSSTSLTAVTPASVSGPVSVTVTNPDGKSATRASAFTFQASVALQSFKPRSETQPADVGLQIMRADGAPVIQWSAGTSYLLQESPVLGPDAIWTTVTTAPLLIGEQNRLEISANGPGKYYRLHKSN